MFCLFSQIDWLYLFKSMIKSYPITGSTQIQVWNINYLRNLIRIIGETDKR